MKNYILIIVFLVSHFFVFAQAPATEWQKCFGGSGSETGQSILQTADGGYIVVGYTTGSNDGDVAGNLGFNDGWIVKISSLGVLQWQKTLGGTFDDVINCIQQTSDGGYIVVGTTTSSEINLSGINGDGDIMVIKLSSLGVQQWRRVYGGSSNEQGQSIVQNTDGSYVIAGKTSSNNGNVTGNNGGDDGWVIKISSIGNLEWQKTFGGSNNDLLADIKKTNDGGYIMVGNTRSNIGTTIINQGNIDFWVIKISSNGILNWQKSFGGNEFDFAYSVEKTSDGGYIVIGGTFSNNGDVPSNQGSGDAWIIKLSILGNVEWQKTIGGTQMDLGYGIQQTTDGGFIAVGSSQSSNGDFNFNQGNGDFFAAKLSNLGVIQWQKTMGGADFENASSVKQTLDGGYVLAGFTDSNNGNVSGNHGFRDFWVVKLASDALSDNSFNNDNFTVYPNPTNHFLNIKNNSNQIIESVSIVNVLGKIILIQNKNFEIIDVSKLQNGMYFIQTTVNRKIYQKKFIKE